MRCLFFDCPVTAGVERPSPLTLGAALRAVGGNTGNILFRYAISSSVIDDLTACHWSDGEILASSQHYDAVILGAANWLNTYHDNGNEKRARILRRLGKPIICIGLGVQHSERTSKKLAFPQGSLDLLSVFRDLNAIVLVRDEFTYDQCIHYGLKNVAVIGCPSNFISISQGQSSRLSEASQRVDLLRRVSLNHGYIRKDVCSHDSALLDVVCKTNGFHIVQDNLNGEIEFALHVEASRSESLAIASWMQRPLRSLKAGLFSTDSTVKRNLARSGRNLRVFFNAPEWIDGLKSSSLVLGTRIHGCIAALQAGTPSVITTIDSRTEGLAEVLGIPRVKISALNSMKRKASPEMILDLAGLDYAPYYLRRQQLLSVYTKSLTAFGLTLSSELSGELVQC